MTISTQEAFTLDPNAVFSLRRASRIPTGAISYQTVQQRGRGVTALVSLDGANGSFKELQEAIAYANRQGGGVIVLTKGTYIMTGDLTLFSNIHLIGQDPHDTILDFNNTNYRILATGANGSELTNIKIQSLTVKNSLLTAAGQAATLHFNYIDDSEISNCIFVNNTSSYGGDPVGGDISLENCDRFSVKNNYSSSSEVFLYTDGDDQVIKENVVTGAAVKGIYASGNRLSIMSNNIINSTTHAIWLEACHEARIINNYISVYTGYGLTLGQDNASDYCVVMGNIISGGPSGISMYNNDKYNVITGNNLTDNDDGIYAVDGDRNIITNNVVVLGADTGITLGAGSDRNLVANNIVLGNTTAQITNNGTNTTLADNIVA